jgi:hypothetical protein
VFSVVADEDEFLRIQAEQKSPQEVGRSFKGMYKSVANITPSRMWTMTSCSILT